jgi:hypothetical protein
MLERGKCMNKDIVSYVLIGSLLLLNFKLMNEKNQLEIKLRLSEEKVGLDDVLGLIL